MHDKNSVQEFSEIYFRYSAKEDGFVARIIKPGGETSAIDLKEAVELESTNDIPEFFKSFFDQTSGAQSRYYKVAIPNLEPGDILEYASYTKSKLDVRRSGFVEFDPQYEICSKVYPIMYNEIDIETDDKSFFKSLSFNGAPEFKKENSDAKDFYRYVFTDKDRGTEKDVNFINRFLVYPMVKFQVIYANSENVKGLLIGGKGELKNGFNKEELALRAYENFAAAGSNWGDPGGAYSLFYTCQDELKKMGAKDWADQQFITTAYYLIRHKITFRNDYIPDRWFAFAFSLLLTRQNIKNELVISSTNTIGKLKDVLFDDEIRYAVKVNDKLYFNCTDHSLPGELVQTLLGNEAYIVSEPDKKKHTQEIKPFTLPDAAAADNAVNYTINSSVTADFNNIVVSRTSNYTGILKTNNISSAMRFTPYVVEDYKSYGGTPPTDKMKPKEQDEYERSVKALKEQFKKAKPDYVKESLEKEFQQKIKFTDFKMSSDGRTDKKKVLTFTEDFELPGEVRKAGKNTW